MHESRLLRYIRDELVTNGPDKGLSSSLPVPRSYCSSGGRHQETRSSFFLFLTNNGRSTGRSIERTVMIRKTITIGLS